MFSQNIPVKLRCNVLTYNFNSLCPPWLWFSFYSDNAILITTVDSKNQNVFYVKLPQKGELGLVSCVSEILKN